MGNNGDELNGELKEGIPEKESPKETPQKQEEPKEFKIAEIWIKESQLILDASPEFWMDKPRALGVLEMCKDIVKQYKHDAPKIITGTKGMMNTFNRIKNRIGGAFGK